MSYKKPAVVERRRDQIARRIAAARKRAGLTMRDCAKRAHVHYTTWFRWEHARVSVPADLLPEIAKATDTSMARLLGMDYQLRPADNGGVAPHVRRAA